MAKIRKFPEYIFPLVLLLVGLWLCFTNYTPGTYLIGWDSLHPEFNFPEAFRRVWQGVWRGEQGLGAIAAHSHMSDWPRISFLWLESFILPTSFLRYSYVYLCLILGPLGVYFFLKDVFIKEKDSKWILPAAFLGALFYLLNLSTLQNFYVPFEMFPSAFATLPWLFLSGLKYLRDGKKTNLLLWLAIVILSSPMAYAATLWYASFAGLFIFLAFYLLVSSPRKIKLKRLLALFVTAVFLNLYWILPSIYSVANQSSVIANAGINRIFSQEAFLRNADHGNFQDILLQRNFLFDWRNFDFASDKFGNLLEAWRVYLINPTVLAVGYMLAGIVLLGLILTVLKRNKVGLATVPLLVFCLFFLLNINAPLGDLYSYFYKHFGIFAEGLRMPFTKFSILYQFLTSFYFGYFAFIFLTKKSRIPSLRVTFAKASFIVLAAAALLYFMLPAFKGNLIGKNVRKEIPIEYQKLFDWVKANPYGRVALFPINSKYGWEYRSWGYEGSGFLTYGIPNPILYRDFDRWSNGNEDFYNQSSFSLYTNDTRTFISTLKKYQVKYLLLDESIINPGGTSDILKIPELDNLFLNSGYRQVATFGFLKVFETDYGSEVTTPPRYTEISSAISEHLLVDPLYLEYGDYLTYDVDTGLVRLNPLLPSTEPIVSEDLSINRGFPEAYNCDLLKKGRVYKTNSPQGILYRAEEGGASCDYLSYPELKHNQAYVLRIAGENKSGRSLKIYLFNLDSQTPEIEEIVPVGKFDETFFVYPKDTDGEGYVLNLETRSFGRIASENILTNVEFYPVDSDYLLDHQIVAEQSIQNNLEISSVQKFGTWRYKIDTVGHGLLQLGQGFEKGWIGATKYGTGFRILDHVKVNSWANGWLIDSGISDQESTIYIFYWPQLLEWVGGVLGALTLMFLLMPKKAKNSGGR